MRTDGRNRPGLHRRALETGRAAGAALALGAWPMTRDAGRRMFPEKHLRPRPRPLLQIRAPDMPGIAATAGRWRRRGALVRRAAARAVHRPRGGTGSDGGGKRTPCVCECKGSGTGRQQPFLGGKGVWQPWETFYLQTCDEGRSVLVSLLFRVFAFDRRATSWSPACRGAERVASPVLPRLLRYSAPRPPTSVIEFESPPQDPVWGWPG